MIPEIKVVKIGGNVIDNPEVLKDFLREFSLMEGAKVLVHGGGKEATRLSAALGVESRMVNGRRVTDRQTLDIVTMVYAGLINKRIVSLLQSFGCDAIGLTGADGNVMEATVRPKTPIDFGYVGDIDPAYVNAGLIVDFADKKMVPVFCAITHDGKGSLLNCNADTVASSVAIALSRLCKVKLVYCFEKDGVLADINDPSSVIPHVDLRNFKELREKGVIGEGMLPKVENALSAVRQGVEEVTIKSAVNLPVDSGTHITL